MKAVWWLCLGGRNVEHPGHLCRLPKSLRPETILREGFEKAHSRSAPSGISPAKYGDYRWRQRERIAERFLIIREDNRWSRQQCVLIICSDPSQLCISQMSNPDAHSSSQLREVSYIRYRLLWSLPEVSQIRRVLCGHARDPQGPKIAFCWACLPVTVVRAVKRAR